MSKVAASRAEPALLFMHIPKTAGTSLRHALEPLYPEDERVYVYPSADLAGAVSPRDFPALPLEARARFRLVMGHFRFGIHEAIPRPARYVTMLRDPLDRVVSLYYHFKTLAPATPGSPGLQDRALIHDDGMSLEAWVFEGQRLTVDNGMVRQLVGHRRAPFGTCPDSMLTEALENISNHFDAVLIRGQMKAAVEVLGKLAGTPLPAVGRRNANREREPLSAVDPALRRRIRELNRLDDQLFQLMVERFPMAYERVMHGRD